MNIFVLALDPKRCAQSHCDKHVMKMVLETAQILCAVHYVLDSPHVPPYRKTHTRHPCVLWAAASADNYAWLVELGKALAEEYAHRYSKHGADDASRKSHKSLAVILWAEANPPPDLPTGLGRTPFAQAMPEAYRRDGDPVGAYRAYYLGEKSDLLKYTRRPAPAWLTSSPPTTLSHPSSPEPSPMHAPSPVHTPTPSPPSCPPMAPALTK